jgi:hypothetical protein
VSKIESAASYFGDVNVVDGGCRFMDAAVAVKEPTRPPAKRWVAGRATSVVRDGEDGPIVV